MTSSYDLRPVLFATPCFKTFEKLAPFFPISESANLPGTQSTVHDSPTTNGYDLLQTLAFGSYFHTALLFLPEYISFEIHGSLPCVLLDPKVQIHFALHDFVKTSLFLLDKSFRTLSPSLSNILPPAS
jgi:hypothetical protein